MRGKLTRSKNGRLNQNGTAPSTWMDDILFYDIEGREIQKQSLQQLGYTDTTWLKYDFPGRLRKSQWSHMNNTTRTLISERFEYDHAGRLVETFHKIGTQAEQKISNQSYNERDELSQKQLVYSGGNYGQSIDYIYNIRKWLTQINDPASCGADLFSEKLGYTDANASLSASAKYNGNIAWIEWRTGANCTVGGLSRNKAGYGFIYDGLDRMTGSRYGENTGSWTNLNRYNENLTYDLNGNILTLGRRGYISAGNWNTIDTLTYTYGNPTNPNWATTIADGSGSALGYPNTSGTFSFDAAGNQTTYSAKGITAITYNHLNLPTKYTWAGSNIEIQYDAAGRKLKKIPSTGNAKTYVGGIEYSASAIEAIYHPEGRARLISSTWEYEYGIKDHLGNPRVYFKYNGSISFLQENHYYPFGMEQGEWTAPSSPENKYKYNGKELNDEFSLGLYDYGARWYDPVVGRWTSVDPLAQLYPSVSPYAYGLNNPMFWTDPTGMTVEPGSQKEWDKQKQNVVGERDKLQSKIDGLNAKATAKGWSAEKLAGKIGNMQDRVNSLNGTIDNLGTLEASSQVYALKSGAGEEGGTTYDPSTGNIVFSYDGTANFVHETTHGGQFESGDIGFDTKTGMNYGSDVFDEVAAYNAQFGYSPSSVSGLTSSSTAKSFGGITTSWVQGITKSDGSKIYAPGGSANTGISPVNMGTNRDGLIKAYPHQKSVLSTVPASFTLKDLPTIYYKK